MASRLWKPRSFSILRGCGGNSLRRISTSGVPTKARFPLYKAAAATVLGTGIAAVCFTLRPSGVGKETELPLEYDPHAIADYWSARPTEVASRVASIASELVPLAVRLAFDHARSEPLTSEERRGRAADLTAALTRLGPLFIKFGQMLSIRPDLVPPEAIAELQKLCDAVPPFATAEAIAVLEQELGSAVADLYIGLDAATLPVAAASLGQVFKATLRDSGDVVAVKVQRPDMVEGIALDLYIIRRWAGFLDWVKPKLTNQRPYDVKLIDTFGRATCSELDYVNEGRNQDLFAEALATRVPEVRVPRVFWQCTSRRVITTEWIEGKQLAKSSTEVINRLTPVGVRCFLAQLLDIGVFHSDPHPGNLLVDQDGRLTLIDFGLCATVEKPATRAMTSALVHLMAGDVPALMHDAVTLEFLDASADLKVLLPILQRLFTGAKLAAAAQTPDSTYTNGQTLDPSSPNPSRPGDRDRKGAVQKRRKQFQAVSKELNQIFFDHPFQVPEYFALITRALITLEGIALTGDKEFDLFQASYPYAMERAVTMLGASELHDLRVHAARAGVRLSDAAAKALTAGSFDRGVGYPRGLATLLGWWDMTVFVVRTTVSWLYLRGWSWPS